MLRQNFYLFSSCNSLSNFRIKFIDGVAAGAFHIIFFAPFKAGDEEEGKIHVSHKDLKSSVRSALIANDHLIVGKILSSLIDSHNKKHRDSFLRLF